MRVRVRMFLSCENTLKFNKCNILQYKVLQLQLYPLRHIVNLFVVHRYIAHLRQEYHNSKFGIFELLVYKETFADALLTDTVS